MKLPTSHDDPSTLYGGLTTLVGSVFTALVVFGALTPEQAAALGAVLTAALPIALTLLVRRKAYAPATVDRVRAEERARFVGDGA